MSDKSIYFVCFPKQILSFSVSHNVTILFQKIEFFLPKIAYIGGKQTNSKTFFLMISLNVLDAFSSTSSYTKSFKFERVMIVLAHSHDGENGRFFNFSQKISNLH